MSHVIERPLRVRHQNPARLLEVRQAFALTPHLRRVVLGGDELAGFVTAAADDHVKLFLPLPGQDRPALPRPGPNGPVYPEDALRPVARDYTPRRFDPVAGELTIDFVLHGDGPAASWAAQATPGQIVGIGGPRGSFLAREGADCLLLVGDETALPAIARRLEELSPGVPAVVILEVEDEADELKLPSAGSTRITWVHRRGTAPGQASLLADVLANTVLPPGDVDVWMAGEISVMRQLRTQLLERRGMRRETLRAAGYWRLGAPGAHETIDG
jgi:NADPH-dependent ferric siderophore reductase